MRFDDDKQRDGNGERRDDEDDLRRGRPLTNRRRRARPRPTTCRWKGLADLADLADVTTDPPPPSGSTTRENDSSASAAVLAVGDTASGLDSDMIPEFVKFCGDFLGGNET